MGEPAPHPDLQEWRNLANALQGGLPPAPTPTFPEGTPLWFMPVITGAYQAGTLTAVTGAPQEFQIPDIPGSASPTGALWTYYSQGFAFGMQQRMALLAPPAPRTQAPKIREPEPFDGTRSKYKSYIMQLHLVFNSDPTCYSTEPSKVAYAASYLAGWAKD